MEEELLLSKVIIDGKLFKEFFYNSKSKPIRMNQYSGQNIRTELYFYNSLGQLEKKILDNFVYSYFYNEKDLLERHTRSSKNNDEVLETIYRYESTSQIKEATSYLNGKINRYFKYEYDAQNNTTTITESQSSDDYLFSLTKVEYDKFRNPYPLNNPVDMVQNNNCKKYFRFYAIMQLLHEYESVFEYNFKKLPTKEYRKYANYPKVKIYEYIYVSK